MFLFYRFYSCQLRHGHILRYIEAPFDFLETLVFIFLRWHSCFTFSFSLVRHSYASALTLFISAFIQRVFLLISWAISAAFFSISAILQRVTRLTSAEFSSVSFIFSAIFLEASRRTSATLSLSSSGISASCRRLERLVSSAFSKNAYTLSSIPTIRRRVSHLVSTTVSVHFFLVSSKSSSRQCIFCHPSSRSASVISSNMSTFSWQVLMER